MAKKKKTNSGLGRKPLSPEKKKQEVRFFVTSETIEKAGGIDCAKWICVNALDMAAYLGGDSRAEAAVALKKV